jgi:hypothetical protein
MPKKGHPEDQIIAALKQQEAGEKTAEICRKLGTSQATGDQKCLGTGEDRL